MRPASSPVDSPVRKAGLRHYADLPGPKGLPLVGNALQVDKARLHEQFEQWSRQFGPHFRLKLGPRRLLVISDHRLIGTVLRDRPEHFRRPLHLGDIVRDMGFEQGLFFANGETWKRQRRMVMSALDPGHVRAYYVSLTRVVSRLEERWRKAARAGIEIDLQADLMRYTVDAIAGLAFGSDVDTLSSEEDTIQRHLNRIFPAIARRATAPVPYWRWFRLAADRALDRSVREVKIAIEGFIAQARQRLVSEAGLGATPRNLLEAMINAADADGDEASHRDIAGNVFMMLVAGEDTTANTLAWLIDLLFRNPPALTRAREEVRRIVPPGTEPTLEQMSQLVYVEACINETMRLKPVAPILPAQATADTVIDGIEVPAETVVISLMRRDATDERYVTEPMAFSPDRWLNASMANADSPMRVSMPFGAGPRLCPGRYLAMLEIKMASAMLLRTFSIDHVGTIDGRPARELFAFAMGPIGLRMKLSSAGN
jgi:cytochrome P450